MFFTIGAIVLAVVSVIICLVIALQEAKSSGLGAGIAGGSDTYWSRNKAKSKEGRLVRITTIAGIVFFVLAILLNVKAFVNPVVASDTATDDVVVEEANDVNADDIEDAADNVETEADSGAETSNE